MIIIKLLGLLMMLPLSFYISCFLYGILQGYEIEVEFRSKKDILDVIVVIILGLFGYYIYFGG